MTALYVRDLAAQGVKDVPLEDLIRMKDHGVSADLHRRHEGPSA